MFAPIEHAVELHPLRPSQCRNLHVVGRLDDGDMYVFQFPVASAVLERRDEQAFGLHVYDFLDIGTHAVSTVGDMTGFCRFHCYTLLYIGDIDIIKVTHTTDGIGCLKVIQQTAKHRGKNDRPLDRRPYDGSRRFESCR